MCCDIVGRGCGEALSHVSDPSPSCPREGVRTSDCIVPHALIDSLYFSVFNHPRILTSDV